MIKSKDVRVGDVLRLRTGKIEILRVYRSHGGYEWLVRPPPKGGAGESIKGRERVLWVYGWEDMDDVSLASMARCFEVQAKPIANPFGPKRYAAIKQEREEKESTKEREEREL